MVQIIREQRIEWPAEGPLELLAPAVSVTVSVPPDVARRRAAGYLGVNVAMALGANNPRLLVGQPPLWRFDIDLALPEVGQIATLGTIDVDAGDGEVVPLDDLQIAELIERCDALASRLAPRATG